MSRYCLGESEWIRIYDYMLMTSCLDIDIVVLDNIETNVINSSVIFIDQQQRQ